MKDLRKDILIRFDPDYPSVISVAEGWLDLVYDLHEMLVYISPDYKIYQIKQKFGGLRFYAEYSPKYDEVNVDLMRRIFETLVSFAEQRSRNICETCGNLGRIQGKSYMFVGCEDHTECPDYVE